VTCEVSGDFTLPFKEEVHNSPFSEMEGYLTSFRILYVTYIDLLLSRSPLHTVDLVYLTSAFQLKTSPQQLELTR
jgi:hypothetical protein